MARNGTGTYNLLTNSWNPAVNGAAATAADWQSLINDVAAAITQSVSADGQTPITGSLNMNGNRLTGLAAGVATGQSLRFEQLFSQGTEADIASAATVDIGAQLTNFLRITGTTTITSFGTNYNGPRFIRFGGTLTLTHNATTLILPSGSNIVTAAGDRAIVAPVGNPGSGWQVIAYQRADGTALVASTDFLNTTRIDVASAATVNLTSSAPNTRHINITGTTTITAFTVAAGQCYFVRFAGALTLTNNANIVTQTGANITTAAGDTCIIRATAANTVEVLCYRPASLASGGRLIAIQVFNSSGSYTKATNNPSYVVVEVQGGGGGGGGSGVTNGVSGGGGAGGYSLKRIDAASLAASETVTIGAGGTGGTGAGGGTGGTGGATTFGSHVGAAGGVGGFGNTAAANAAIGGAGGGVTIPGDIVAVGANGECASGNVNAGTAHSGSGGESRFGGGGRGQANGTNAAGNAASANGGSGGGGGVAGASFQPGGAGGSGRCIVWEYA